MIACINCISYIEIKGGILILKYFGILQNNLNRTYTLEEFEFINDQLKTHTLEINVQPDNLFELDKNEKLIPMPQATINMEAVVSEIVRQLSNWNIYARQGSVVTSSQGEFNFHVRGGRTIRAPDISFTSKNVYCHLTQQQLWTIHVPKIDFGFLRYFVFLRFMQNLFYIWK
ncbi:hypothetical protein Glove_586g28 [Diversispora epigaea]|uniref:Uncharacterized protein n=1 Tax=Diversispora epigaea TaxID=1348612 RepID=A0A397GCU5_9GLOM|nr:hypothetical protein Glove_586g28 [Diversispora epigaea]